MPINFILRSALLFAATGGSISCAMYGQVAATPLHAAASRGEAAAIRQIVGAGADVNAMDDMGATPLYWAAQGGHPLGPHRCGPESPGRLDAIAALLDLGANPNAQDRRPRGFGRSSGWTPLIVSLHHKQFQSARLLLERGADPNILSDQGMSVMEMAKVESAPPELIRLIVDKGFNAEKAHRRAD
jgi:ankyrin repeat protein